MAGITDFLASKIKKLTVDAWDGLIRTIDNRFSVLEEQLGIERRVTESILQRGLQVIEDGIGPAILEAEAAADNIARIADLGMIFTAPSATTVLIGSGTKTFTIPVDRKNQFSPAAIVMAYAGDDYTNSIIGVAKSYNRATGGLVVDVIETTGSGVHSAWTITPVATTADLEALRDQVQDDRQESGLNAGAAANAKADAQAIATDFRKKYVGTRAADPANDGNGDPVSVGAMYTNSVSGKLRYFGLSGWQDTTAGSNIIPVQFTTDNRGTGAYILPEAPASKNNCFVILGGAPLLRSAYNVNGTSFSFTSDPGVGKVVEVTIIGQLAIGTPSDSSVAARQINGTDAPAILQKLGVTDAFNAVAQALGQKLGLIESVDAAAIKGSSAAAILQKLGITDALAAIATALGLKLDRSSVGMLTGFRNKIMNGDFNVWQRGTFFGAVAGTIRGADRWSAASNGDTVEVGRIAMGNTDPINANYFHRTNVVSVAGAGNYAQMLQAIESVRTLAGKKATLTFWARSASGFNRNMATELFQFFGTGGAPSSPVTDLGKKVHAVGINWTKFTYSFDIPSILGKTLGSNNDDQLLVVFWFEAGATYAGRSSGIGQLPSGAIDIAHVSLVEGDATSEDDPFSERPPEVELAMCQRYYEGGTAYGVSYAASATAAQRCVYPMKVTKRVVPSVTLAIAGGTITSPQVVSSGANSLNIGFASTGAGQDGSISVRLEADF